MANRLTGSQTGSSCPASLAYCWNTDREGKQRVNRGGGGMLFIRPFSQQGRLKKSWLTQPSSLSSVPSNWVPSTQNSGKELPTIKSTPPCNVLAGPAMASARLNGPFRAQAWDHKLATYCSSFSSTSKDGIWTVSQSGGVYCPCTFL